MHPLKPKDLIALVVILGYLLLALFRPEVMLPSAVMLIVGYYFAKRSDKKDPGE